MNIELHIERLVLDGIPLEPRQGEWVRRAVEQELSRLLSAGGFSPALMTGGATPSLRAQDLTFTAVTPQHIGVELAQSIYNTVGSPVPNPGTKLS